jgi:hypothetical protein
MAYRPEYAGPVDMGIARTITKAKAQHFIYSWHPANKAARILVLDQRQPHADVAAAGPGAGEVFCHLVEAHVAVINLDKKLYGTLQPDVQTVQARRFQKHAIV